MKPSLNFRTITLLAALVGGGALAGFASAQTTSDNGNVAVIINGHKITAAEVSLAIDDILPQIGEVPPNLRYAFVVEYLVERHLLAQEAVRLKLVDSKAYIKRMRFYQAKALRDALFAEKIAPLVTDELIESEYKKLASQVDPVPRAHARHIIVATETEAEKISNQLATGTSFEELAKRHNIDGSNAYGGDLGKFTRNEMVPVFSNAVFALKKGQISAPVKTDHGWHIIKLEDMQDVGPQPLERVKGPIKLSLQRKAVQDQVRKLRETGTIEVMDPDLVKLQTQVREQRRKIEEKQLQEGSGKLDKQ